MAHVVNEDQPSPPDPWNRAAAVAEKLEAMADLAPREEALPLLREAAAIWVTLARG
ncbi:hypothetical protein [Parafrankia discariae]|uniref:hypothetical protein n=1 Tax=Parafrankia discariae TaxID=365528 RepID=UPI00036E72F1|nr:hypothetical protein [Parafrankia discariae]